MEREKAVACRSPSHLKAQDQENSQRGQRDQLADTQTRGQGGMRLKSGGCLAAGATGLDRSSLLTETSKGTERERG